MGGHVQTRKNRIRMGGNLHIYGSKACGQERTDGQDYILDERIQKRKVPHSNEVTSPHVIMRDALGWYVNMNDRNQVTHASM